MLLSYEDKARIERVLSITGSKTKYVKQVEAVNFSKGSLIQQAKSCSVQEVNHIPKVRERKLQDESFGNPMLPEEQESGQVLVLQEN